MDYLLSREFDAQYIAICIVARSVVIVVLSLYHNVARKRYDFKLLDNDELIAQLSC